MTTSIIPFRSLVRRATVASAHERQLRAAYQIGLMRLVFLKGMVTTLGCEPPAAPTSQPELEWQDL